MGHAYLGLSRDRRCYWLTAYAASALAVLTKGPVGLVLRPAYCFLLCAGVPGLAPLEAFSLGLGPGCFFAACGSLVCLDADAAWRTVCYYFSGLAQRDAGNGVRAS